MSKFEDKSASRCNNVRTSLNSIFMALRYEANLKESPFATVPSRSDDSKSYRPFTAKECAKIVENAEGEWKLVCLVAMYTGARFADIAHLSKPQVDWDLRLLHILPRKLARFGDKDIIPIHPKLEGPLRDVCANAAGLLMPGLAAGQESSDKDVTGYFSELLKSLEISGKVGFHSFRHTFNTNLENAGVDVGTRQKLTGHSTVEMNLRYSQDIESMRRAIETLK